ncbi:mechanosensitive ion channel family protein [Halorubrum sp. PV6]|uniref:mechanosensitive ion channel family protein n=1 Tax=Halorubrum sp. PV6 TaxID=634157 RepID=UPI00119850DF|nr:mechanosensitive ion channel family protein [Halorubrum sp. PV6]AZQ16117.1 mechanosensitive ion channel family protein [Halorubrum sp. PV6]
MVLYALGRGLLVLVVRRLLRRTRLNRTVRKAVARLLRAVVIVVAVSIEAGVAGFETTPSGSALVVGVISLAVGFAAQEMLANFVSGIFIVQDRRLNVGDLVEWEGASGAIDDIGFRVTTIKTANNETVLVPNSEFATKPVTNRTYNDPQAISYEFGIGYGDDIDVATDVLRAVTSDVEAVLDDPEPSVRVSDLADSSVLLSARVWLAKADRNRRASIKAEFIRRVNERCAAAGIDLSTTTQHPVTGELAASGNTDGSTAAD